MADARDARAAEQLNEADPASLRSRLRLRLAPLRRVEAYGLSAPWGGGLSRAH